MKVWELGPDASDYCEYGFPEEEDRAQFEQIQETHLWEGRMAGPEWHPPILLRNIQRKDGAFGYFLDFQVLFSQEAMAIFKPLLGGDVEWLPVLNDQQGLYYMNALAQVDCIDYDRSKFHRAEISGKITAVQRFELLPGRIGDRLVFKIPVFGWGRHVMVTDRFRAVCEENRLPGLDFSDDNLVWASMNPYLFAEITSEPGNYGKQYFIRLEEAILVNIQKTKNPEPKPAPVSKGYFLTFLD